MMSHHDQVYDYNRLSGDDYLGEALLSLPLPGEVLTTMMSFTITILVNIMVMEMMTTRVRLMTEATPGLRRGVPPPQKRRVHCSPEERAGWRTWHCHT